MQDNSISTPSSAIASHHKRWKLNRDFIEGEYAVKSTVAGYLPRLPIHDATSFANANEAYSQYLNRTNFFPASSRILDGLKGMICGSACKKDPVSGVIGV